MIGKLSRAPVARIAAGCMFAFMAANVARAADVVRYPLPNNFPIARAVEVPAGKTIIFPSGTTPKPADPKATANSPE